MRSVENLKKLKELLDAGIITEEDFEKKKKEVLSGSIQQEISAVDFKEKKKIQRKLINKSVLKKILLGIGIIVILAIVFSVGQKMINNNRMSKIVAALEAEIAPIMDDYGLSVYAVKFFDHSYDVFAEGFESLSKDQALSCLKELDSVSIDNPNGDGEIDFGMMTNVHPGLDVEYSYWRVSSSIVFANKMVGGNYKKAGIYCNQYGITCVYECDN